MTIRKITTEVPDSEDPKDAKLFFEAAWAFWDIMPEDLKPTFIKVLVVVPDRNPLNKYVQFHTAIKLGNEGGEEKVIAYISSRDENGCHALGQPAEWAKELRTRNYSFEERVDITKNGKITAAAIAKGLKYMVRMRVEFLQAQHREKIQGLEWFISVLQKPVPSLEKT